MIDHIIRTAHKEVRSETSVLIAGGGPVGLACAIELVRRGIEVSVIEPRIEVSHARPRCKTVNVRTMEHLRRWGIADRLRDRAPLPSDWSQDVVFCTSLTGWELSRFSGVLGLAREGDRFPELGLQVPQYVLEELLRDVLTELSPAALSLGSRVLDVKQDEAEALVSVETAGGHRATVKADCVIGADGPRSRVREAIGAAYRGKSGQRPNFGMVVSAPGLLERVAHAPAVQYWVLNSEAPALMGPIDLNGTWWIIAFGVDEEAGRREAIRIVNAVAGTPIQARVLSHDPWTAQMKLVNRARDRRVFLAGDAAHLNPPFGGHGLNTGIGDAVDLGWKIAAVLEGWGKHALLDSYEAERRPVQLAVIAEAEQNNQVLASDLMLEGADGDDDHASWLRARMGDTIQRVKAQEFFALDLVLDLAYQDSPVLAEDEAKGRPNSGRVGARLPHVWIDEGRSVYDELGEGLTLLSLVPGQAGEDVARMSRCAVDIGVPLTTFSPQSPVLADRCGANFALVRPDQHVAWRGDRLPENPRHLLDVVRGAMPLTSETGGRTSTTR